MVQKNIRTPFRRMRASSPYGASSNILKPRLRLEEKHSNLAALDEMQLIRQLR